MLIPNRRQNGGRQGAAVAVVVHRWRARESECRPARRRAIGPQWSRDAASIPFHHHHHHYTKTPRAFPTELLLAARDAPAADAYPTALSSSSHARTRARTHTHITLTHTHPTHTHPTHQRSYALTHAQRTCVTPRPEPVPAQNRRRLTSTPLRAFSDAFVSTDDC